MRAGGRGWRVPTFPLGVCLGVCHEPVGISGGIWLPYGHPAARAAMGPGTCRGIGVGAQQHGPSEVWGIRELSPNMHPMAAHPGSAPLAVPRGNRKSFKEHFVPRKRDVRRNRSCKQGIKISVLSMVWGQGYPGHPLSWLSPSSALGCSPTPHSHPRLGAALTLEQGGSRSCQLCHGGGPKPRDARRPPAEVPAGRQTGSRLWSSDGQGPNKKPELSFTGVPACGGRTLVPSGGC